MKTVINSNKTSFTYYDARCTKIAKVERIDGEYSIYNEDGKLHCEDGPAYVSSESQRFFIGGREHTLGAWIRVASKGNSETAAYLKLKFD